MNEPQVLIVMGVSGSGKTTVAKALAERLGWVLLEGDDLHPPSNVAKMASGHPLTDEDRLPWLRAIAKWIADRLDAGESGIVTCSALKHTYRDILVSGRPNVRLVFLRGDKELIAERMRARKGHFMPATLLDSQFATLEEPSPAEHPLVVNLGGSTEQEVEDILAQLRVPAGT